MTDTPTSEAVAKVELPPGGIVYLLHVSPPYHSQSGLRARRLQHILGYARVPLAEHFAALRAGGGRRRGLMAAVLAAGCRLEVADTWECDSKESLGKTIGKLRRLRAHERICSICHPGNLRGTGSKWPAKEV